MPAIDIREFRRACAELKGEEYRLLCKSSDFFSLSSLRDLIFHVQEHRFSIPQIEACLDELGLSFCGFEQKNAVTKFRDLYDTGANVDDLSLWHHYEVMNPNTFGGMYQFWCQKP